MNLIGELTLVDSLKDHASVPELNGAYALTTARINGKTFVYVGGFDDSGIQILRLRDDGTLVERGSVADNATLALSGVQSLEVAEVNGSKFLVAVGFHDDGISSFRIDEDNSGSDGELIHVATEFGTVAAYNLNGPYDLEIVHKKDGKVFAVATSYYDDAVTVFQVKPNGTLQHTDSVLDTESVDHRLDAPTDLKHYKINGQDFIFTGSYSDNGINVYAMNANGKLSLQDADALSNARLYSLEVMRIGTKDYLVASDTYSG